MKRLLIAMATLALVASCGAPPQTSSAPSPSPATTAVPSPIPPVGFLPSGASGGSVDGSDVLSVRVEQRTGYDRLVIEFAGGVPNYTVTPQSTATFTRSPRGDQVALEGSAGVLIQLHMVTNWTSYDGPAELRPGYPCIREARLVENFEGHQQWAVGVDGTPALRVLTLSSPARLVVDIAAV